MAEIASIQLQDIERAEAWCAAPKEERIKLGTAVLVQAGEFAVQPSLSRGQLTSHAIRQFSETGELVPIPQDWDAAPTAGAGMAQKSSQQCT